MPIRQTIEFNAPPARVFQALTNAHQFAELTGASAEIIAEVGGMFSCFDGKISGMTIEIIPNERLVQAWRVGTWDPGTYSIVRFALEASEDAAARLVMDHTGFPEEHADHLETGWYENYWEPMKKYLET